MDIFSLIEQNDLTALKSILSDKTVLNQCLNQRNESGDTPLIVAAGRNANAVFQPVLDT